MMDQDYLYWSLVYELVAKQGYRVLKLNENGEVWLELLERKNRRILRLRRFDIDWGNWLIHDIENTSKVITQLKKQSYRKKMKVYNIYISTYPPVDDWKRQVHHGDDIETILIEVGNREEELTKLFGALHLSSPDFKSWFERSQDTSFLIYSIRQTEKKRMQEEQNLLYAKKPFLTYILVIVNIIMYVLLEWYGSSTDISTLIKFGAKFNYAILEGDWWRFITPMFLHIGFLHLFMNSLALYYLGISVERIYGTWRFFLIYFIAGFTGAVASFAFTTQISAGASGAIFGCFGALLYFGVVHPSLFYRTMGMNVISVIAINLAFGFLVPMVDNSAHIGGLIGGFLASAFVHLPKHKLLVRQLGAVFIISVVTAAALTYGYYYKDQLEDPLIIGQVSQKLIEQGDFEKANEILSDVVKANHDVPPEIYFFLSYTEIKLGNLEEAVSLLEKVVKEKNDFHEAHYNLAILYLEFGEHEKARLSIEKALAIKPNDRNYQSLLEQINNIK